MRDSERAEQKKNEVCMKMVSMIGAGYKAERIVDTIIEMMKDSEDFMPLATREQMIYDLRVRFNIQ